MPSPASRGSVTARPRALTCSSSKAWAMLLIGPQGTALSSSSAIHSAVVRVRVTASIIGISTSRCRTRRVLVAKRGSLAHSAWPAASQKRVNWPLLPMASSMAPSFVWKSW
jgi:hypothetical protein